MLRINKAKFSAFALLSAAFVLTACQQNPSDDIVVNKNEGVLEEAIKQKNSEPVEAGQVPENYTDTFEMAAKDVACTINAKVEYPGKEMPVLRAKPRDITVEEVKRWAEVLFEGNTAYEPKRERTKAEIEEQILSYREAMSDKEKFYAEKGDVWDAYENKIKALEKDYETAPDTYETKKTDWTFHDWYYYDIDATESLMYEQKFDLSKTKQLSMETQEGALNKKQGYIVAYNRDEQDFRLHSLWFYYKDEQIFDTMADSGTTYDEALIMADDVKKQLGFEDWVLCENYEGDSDNFMFMFAPVYNDIETFVYSVDAITSDDDYASKYYYESLEINVDKGEVSAVVWQSPVEVVAEENSNVKTISFGDALASFKNHVKSEYTASKLEFMGLDGKDIKITVDEIRCGLTRIKIKDNSDEFYMIPAWEFRGKVEQNDTYSGDIILATINGVDGSVIDTYLGY